jgi:tetratricopeptide (TPR) repeat protein
MHAGRLDEAKSEFVAALEHAERTRGPRHPAVAHALHSLSNVLQRQGDLPAALDHVERAVALAEAAIPDHSDIALMRAGRASILAKLGRTDEARDDLRAQVARFEPELGPHHTAVLALKTNLAGMLANEGAFAQAEPLLQAVAEGRTATLGVRHPTTLDARNNVAVITQLSGRFEEAEREHRQVLELSREVLGPRHRAVATTLADLAGALAYQGRNEEAVLHYRSALAIFAELAPGDVLVGQTHNDLGTALLALERFDEAATEFRAALDELRAILPADHPHLAAVLANVGLAASKAHDDAAALEAFESAVAIVGDGATCPPRIRADVRGGLARALWRTGGDRARARTLATSAVADYGSLPPETTQGLIEPLQQGLRGRG